jgi:hypothetical protein
VDKEVANQPEAGFTTIVAFCLQGEYLCGASSGDSALVVTGTRERGTILTGRQHKNPPVGSGEAFFVGFAAKLEKPWAILAMTDGVWKYAGWEAILNIASDENGDDIISSLRNRSRLPYSGRFQDDFTVVVLQETAT